MWRRPGAMRGWIQNFDGVVAGGAVMPFRDTATGGSAKLNKPESLNKPELWTLGRVQ
jgi:hypothetical protein